MPEEPLFDKDFIRKLEYLNLVARKVLSGLLKAERQSHRKGVSLEFSDYRNYSAGDDFRHVDWHIYGRLEEFFVKLFREEENLQMNVFLDSSRSMDYGARNKYFYARRIAAALAYIGMANMDSVSLYPFGDNLGDGMHGMRSRGKIFGLLNYLERLESRGETDMQRMARAFTKRSRRRSLDIVVSDFYDLTGYKPALKALKYVKHDVYVVHVVDALEEDPALKGDLKLDDLEVPLQLDVTVTDRLLDKYKKAFTEHQEAVETFCRKNEFGYVKAPSAVPFDQLVMTILRKGELVA